MTIVEFLTARYDEEEAVVLAAIKDDGGQDGGLEDAFDRLTKSRNVAGPLAFEPRFGEPLARMIVRNTPRRALADLASKRAILEWHKRWPVLIETEPKFDQVDEEGLGSSYTFRMSKQIQWQTEQEYRVRFGSEPPTGPILKLLAQPYADHPDYDPSWAVEVHA